MLRRTRLRADRAARRRASERSEGQQQRDFDHGPLFQGLVVAEPRSLRPQGEPVTRQEDHRADRSVDRQFGFGESAGQRPPLGQRYFIKLAAEIEDQRRDRSSKCRDALHDPDLPQILQLRGHGVDD